jgi:hypothetical protein
MRRHYQKPLKDKIKEGKLNALYITSYAKVFASRHERSLVIAVNSGCVTQRGQYWAENVILAQVNLLNFKQCRKLASMYVISGGRDSSIGIATGYGLDDPGIESRWE